MFGSPLAEMSGTARIGVLPKYSDTLVGTLPCWYQGCGNSTLVPPPPPELYVPGGGGVQAPLVSWE